MNRFNLAEHFVVLTPDKVASTVLNGPTVYQDLDRDFGDFKGHDLVALHTFHEDWPSWEVHPNGDETVVLISGAATFIVEVDGVEQEVGLSQPGDTLIVPRGIWHTARIAETARILFITPGEGTQNIYQNTE